MQIKQSIMQAFNRKGYYPNSSITQRQFHILMNTFIVRSHTVFDENITQEIWKQSLQRNQQLLNNKNQENTDKLTNIKDNQTKKIDKGLGSKHDNMFNSKKDKISESKKEAKQKKQEKITNIKEDRKSKQQKQKIQEKKNIKQQPKQQQQKKQPTKHLKCQLIISTLVDAIQILTNRILQCQQRLQELKTKRQQLQQNQDFSKLETIKQKIQTLNTDLNQFDKEFKMLTEAFLTETSKFELKTQLSIKRSHTLAKGQNSRNINQSSQLQKQRMKRKQLKELQLAKAKKSQQLTKQQSPVSQQSLNQANSFQNQQQRIKQSKKCAFYFLVFIILLEMSVCLIKFNFVNLLVELIGFLVLVEDKHMASMLRVAFYSCVGSLMLDCGWLFMYSQKFIFSFYNTELLHHMIPYHRYIWFVTVLQLIMKLIYIYFLKSYNTKTQSFKQEQKMKIQQMVIKDKYIPQVKKLANIGDEKEEKVKLIEKSVEIKIKEAELHNRKKPLVINTNL